MKPGVGGGSNRGSGGDLAGGQGSVQPGVSGGGGFASWLRLRLGLALGLGLGLGLGLLLEPAALL